MVYQVTVELREMLDSVLLGPEGEKWKQTRGELEHPQEYEDWLDAQAMPSRMKLHVSNWKDVIYPLEKTRSRSVLEDMWYYINVVRTNDLYLRVHFFVLNICYPTELQVIHRQGSRYAMEPRGSPRTYSSMACF